MLLAVVNLISCAELEVQFVSSTKDVRKKLLWEKSLVEIGRMPPSAQVDFLIKRRKRIIDLYSNKIAALFAEAVLAEHRRKASLDNILKDIIHLELFLNGHNEGISAEEFVRVTDGLLLRLMTDKIGYKYISGGKEVKHLLECQGLEAMKKYAKIFHKLNLKIIEGVRDTLLAGDGETVKRRLEKACNMDNREFGLHLHEIVINLKRNQAVPFAEQIKRMKKTDLEYLLKAVKIAETYRAVKKGEKIQKRVITQLKKNLRLNDSGIAFYESLAEPVYRECEAKGIDVAKLYDSWTFIEEIKPVYLDLIKDVYTLAIERNHHIEPDENMPTKDNSKFRKALFELQKQDPLNRSRFDSKQNLYFDDRFIDFEDKTKEFFDYALKCRTKRFEERRRKDQKKDAEQKRREEEKYQKELEAYKARCKAIRQAEEEETRKRIHAITWARRWREFIKRESKRAPRKVQPPVPKPTLPMLQMTPKDQSRATSKVNSRATSRASSEVDPSDFATPTTPVSKPAAPKKLEKEVSPVPPTQTSSSSSASSSGVFNAPVPPKPSKGEKRKNLLERIPEQASALISLKPFLADSEEEEDLEDSEDFDNLLGHILNNLETVFYE